MAQKTCRVACVPLFPHSSSKIVQKRHYVGYTLGISRGVPPGPRVDVPKCHMTSSKGHRTVAQRTKVPADLGQRTSRRLPGAIRAQKVVPKGQKVLRNDTLFDRKPRNLCPTCHREFENDRPWATRQNPIKIWVLGQKPLCRQTSDHRHQPKKTNNFSPKCPTKHGALPSCNFSPTFRPK